jgi:hypothetical protein
MSVKPKKTIKETPLLSITLRKYEKPFRLSEKEMVKKLCLSMGLLQPGDSRDVIVDILYIFLKSKNPLNAKEIEERTKFLRKEYDNEKKGITPANIRRQLKKLKDLMIIENKEKNYYFNEKESLKTIFEEKIKKYYLETITERVSEYCEYADKIRNNEN